MRKTIFIGLIFVCLLCGGCVSKNEFVVKPATWELRWTTEFTQPDLFKLMTKEKKANGDESSDWIHVEDTCNVQEEEPIEEGDGQ